MIEGAWVVAHQGGWDEALILVTPLVAFVVLVRTAVTRAAKAADTDPDQHHRPSAR